MAQTVSGNTGLMNTGANLMGVVNALLLSSVAAILGWKVALSTGAGFAVLSAILIVLTDASRQMDQSD